MNALSRFFITIPVVLFPVTAYAAGPALAGGAPAQQAVEILARAQAADGRCRILSPTERDELGRYSARAELAATSQVSASAAQAARARGEAAGKSGDCSASAADVRETLIAAREAIAASGGESQTRMSGTAKSKRKAEPEGPDEATLMRKVGSGLGRYGELVEAYYLERNCRHLPKPQADRFWRAIVRIHKSVVVRNGAAAVAPVMRRAERQARRTSCGSATMARVQDGYAELLNR